MPENTTPHRTDLAVDYVELHASDVARTKRFYAAAFGWAFEDYGPDYAAFTHGPVGGGFTTGKPTTTGTPLVVLYAATLEDALRRVEAAGGKVVKPIFSFPGGQRFHFADPGGNELAVWSDH